MPTPSLRLTIRSTFLHAQERHLQLVLEERWEAAEQHLHTLLDAVGDHLPPDSWVRKQFPPIYSIIIYPGAWNLRFWKGRRLRRRVRRVISSEARALEFLHRLIDIYNGHRNLTEKSTGRHHHLNYGSPQFQRIWWSIFWEFAAGTEEALDEVVVRDGFRSAPLEKETPVP